MRIRSTKPEFWRSNTIAQLDWSDRFVLKGLEAYVDDNGVGKDDVELIASDVFPRDLCRSPRDTLARLSEALHRIVEVGLVVRYTVNQEDLIYIDRWRELQRIDRPSKGRFPRPDGTLEYADITDHEPSRACNEPSPRARVKEQGNRGTGEQGISTELTLVEGVQGETPTKTTAGKPAAKRGTQIDDNYMPTEKTIAAIREDYPTVTDAQLRYQHKKFMDHWRKTGKTMKDWNATWRNWMRTAGERGEFRGTNGQYRNTEKINEWDGVTNVLLGDCGPQKELEADPWKD